MFIYKKVSMDTLSPAGVPIIYVTIQFTLYSIILMYSVTGDIKYWDPRFTQSVRTLPTSLQINACDIHNYAPLLAWWVAIAMATIVGLPVLVHSASRNQSIKIYSTDSDELVNSIRYHDGFMGQKIGPTRCLAFHPYKVKIIQTYTIYSSTFVFR